MTLFENIRLAFVGLSVNKLRAFLTMLGIIIGVAAVITLVSVGRGVEGAVVGEFEGLGNNLLFVFPQDVSSDGLANRNRIIGLTMDDYEALRDPLRAPDILRVVPSYDRPAIVVAGREEARSTISGTTPEFTDLRDFYPIVGNFFNEQDLAAGARVAVLGQTAYENLFPNGENPIGETIRVNNLNLRIIGLMEEKGGSGFNDQDDVILIPITTAQRRLFPARRADGKVGVDALNVQAISEERTDAAVAQIGFVLRETHNISFRAEDDFQILSQDELVGAFSQITGVLTIFLAFIASISLVVGGIGIMNIMLVSVTERTREIGLRKALGARPRAILTQFLIEAIVLSVVGGLIGLLIGMAGAFIIGNFSDLLTPVLAWDSVVLAIGVSTIVGLFFGIFPARRAAGLNPIDALRYE
ncbi:MAG: ABC transporter permease [Chloroflexota bacterium]